MASAPPAQQTFKPTMTFAKVAASPYKPTSMNQNQNQNQTNSPTNTISNDLNVAQISPPAAPKTKDATIEPVGKNASVGTHPIVVMPKRPILEKKPSSKVVNSTTNAITAGESRPAEALTKASPTDDTSTQVSSSGSSAKLANVDKQSIASGTTFALDEKASLRPDDSVSTKAIDEEDIFTGTGPAGSRVGSDTDARAFSDQLHQIAVMAPRGVPTVAMRPNISFGEVPMNIISPQPQLIPVNGVAPVILPTITAPTPDEKLLEALESPRDRVYVLKIEQDILDFLKNDKDSQLSLPETNAFYRMLAHKLADYYGLEHAVQTSTTGSAVLITKTSCHRIPNPLSGLSRPSTQASTPPPAVQSRKIMRRGDEMAAGIATDANSEGPSKAGSEDGNGTPNGAKSKTDMTREEREAKYAEARLRIFGEQAESAEAGKEGAEPDVSRTSSAAGKKKTKKQRNDSNDDFEPRSQFPGYYPNQYAANGFPQDAYYFPQYNGMVAGQPQYGMPQPGSPPSVMYQSNFQQVDGQGQYSYISPQGYPVSPTGIGAPVYGKSPANYDLSSHFQQGMQFSHPSPPGPMPQMAPKANSPSFPAPYPNQQAQHVPGQSQGLPYESYPYSQPGFMPMMAPERSMSSPGQGQTYAYGQLPSAAYPNGRPPKHQHPVPGSYKGPAFNPQTQAFVPGGGRSGQMMPMQQSLYAGYVSVPNHMQSMQQTRSTPSTSNPSTYSSPRGQPASMALQGNNTSNPYGNNSYAAPSSAPPANNGNPANLPAHPPSTQQQQHQSTQLTHPLPQPPHPSSSIAKWGVPSHLPPKPPPPQDQHPQKFLEINRGLPPHTQIPGLPRSVYVPGSGMIGSPGHGGK
ncbi:hypothetical protein EJ08DRAFT_659486 [Tothia fuscella]|uniref:R3H domain-containing protein n=1 Tax=Tothia fuscella TaxID=1048955 RepID=A0A9P4NUY9_9PEZI|nr:hypothetical protein EJ08DRAFT_659486 [Tothia fuscella]